MLGFAIVTSLPDVRVTSGMAPNTWFPLANREVSLNKSTNTSKLRITYQDTLGAKTFYYNGCQWRILVGTTVVAVFSDADVEGPWGWRMHNGAHVAWAFGIPAGTHQIKVENLRVSNSAAIATECLSGWNTTGNFLSVEEIP